MKPFHFPTNQYFSLCVPYFIFDEFKSLIDTLFVVAKLKDYHIQMEEKIRLFEILIVNKSTRIEITIFFDNFMSLEDIMFEYIVFDQNNNLKEEKQSEQSIDWFEKINKIKEVIDVI